MTTKMAFPPPYQVARARAALALALALVLGGGMPLAWAQDPAEAASSAAMPQAGTLGIIDAYRAARDFDPKFRSAVQEYESSKEYRIQGRSNVLPQIGLSGYANHNVLTTTGPQQVVNEARTGYDTVLGVNHSRYDSNNVALQLRQPLINFDAMARWRQGEAQSLYGEAVFFLRGNELTLRVSEAYTNVLLAADQLRLARAQVDAFNEQFAGSEKLLARGEGTRTDVLEAQSNLELAQAEVIEAEAALDGARATLAAVTGPLPQALPVWSPDKFQPAGLQLETLPEWEAAGRLHSLEIAARKLSVEAARLEVAKAEAGHLPRLDLVASVSKSASDTVNTINYQYYQRSIGVQLNVPLYSGGAISSQVRQAVANQAKAEADLDDTVQSVIVELRKQFSAVQSGAKRIRALESASRSAALQLDATRKSVTAGVRINLDVLRAVQQQTQTARDLSKARFDYMLAWLHLRSSAGLLSQDDLGEIAAQLQQPIQPVAELPAVPAGEGKRTAEPVSAS